MHLLLRHWQVDPILYLLLAWPPWRADPSQQSSEGTAVTWGLRNEGVPAAVHVHLLLCFWVCHVHVLTGRMVRRCQVYTTGLDQIWRRWDQGHHGHWL